MPKSQQILYKEKFSVQVEPEVEVIRVIRTRLTRRGEGTDNDPIRRVEQYWSLDGQLLWEDDPCKKE